jgi:GNAT superfamily N-acetyltransferase
VGRKPKKNPCIAPKIDEHKNTEDKMRINSQLDHLPIDPKPTGKEINLVRERLKAYNQDQTRGEYSQPGIEINLVLKTPEHEVIGGIIVSTQLHVMHLEVLWVAEAYRQHGYGRELVLAAERIGYQNGCLTSHTWTFEFQGPAFYPKVGYELIGVYDGYPNDLKEYVFKKHLKPAEKISSSPQPGLNPLKDPRWRGRQLEQFSDRSLGKDQVAEESNASIIKSFANGLYITNRVSKDEIEILHAGLRSYVDQYVGDEKNGIGIKLVARDGHNQVIAGLHAWTTIQNMLVEFVWVDGPYRGMGLGTRLLMEAESIAREHGCIASLICPMSFHSPEFFQDKGYRIFGYSDGYPEPVLENYMIKKYLTID